MTETTVKSLVKIVVMANQAVMTGRVRWAMFDWETTREYRILTMAADGTETDLVFDKILGTHRLWRNGAELTGWN